MLLLTVDAPGKTEKDGTLSFGDKVEYLGHIPGGMVKIRFSNGDEDVAHPGCFREIG